MPTKKEPQPILLLGEREQPYQKISVLDMPMELYTELNRRAQRFNKQLKDYCRVVLEHAIQHKDDYTGPIDKQYDERVAVNQRVHIPLVDKAFKQALVAWDPYGLKKQTAIVKSILKKHIEVRSW